MKRERMKEKSTQISFIYMQIKVPGDHSEKKREKKEQALSVFPLPRIACLSYVNDTTLQESQKK